MTVPALKVTKGDRDRLASAAIAALRHERRSSASASMLLSEVARAVVIESDTPPPHVVAPHRDVEIHDNITNTNRRSQLVYPREDGSNRGLGIERAWCRINGACPWDARLNGATSAVIDTVYRTSGLTAERARSTTTPTGIRA